MQAICVGELLIDFTPGTQADSYVRHAGGAPANVAVMLQRGGIETGFLGKVGDDDFGRFLVRTLEDNGVRLLCQPYTEEAVTTLAFVTLAPNGERSFTFARKPGADLLLRRKDIPEDAVQQCTLLHAGSVSLTAEPSRVAVRYAMELAHGMGKLVCFDINYREMLWSREAAKQQVDAVLPMVDLLKFSEEELDFVAEEAQMEAFMQKFDVPLMVQTLGAKGARYYLRSQSGFRQGFVEGFCVHAVDATGAGDAFWGGFLAALLRRGVTSRAQLSEDTVRQALEEANCCGALCVQKKGGIPALPFWQEVQNAALPKRQAAQQDD